MNTVIKQAAKLSLLAAVLFSSTAALAGPGGGPGPGRGHGPCAADVQKLCAGVQPGGGRVLDCLKSHEADLSAACKARGEQGKARKAERKEAREAVHAACKDDVAKLCGGVTAGGGSVMRCLRDNLRDNKVSAACKDAVAEERGKHHR
jgi:hypothetical protein